jgi:hypothetical protein
MVSAVYCTAYGAAFSIDPVIPLDDLISSLMGFDARDVMILDRLLSVKA